MDRLKLYYRVTAKIGYMKGTILQPATSLDFTSLDFYARITLKKGTIKQIDICGELMRRIDRFVEMKQNQDELVG